MPSVSNINLHVRRKKWKIYAVTNAVKYWENWKFYPNFPRCYTCPSFADYLQIENKKLKKKNISMWLYTFKNICSKHKTQSKGGKIKVWYSEKGYALCQKDIIFESIQ